MTVPGAPRLLVVLLLAVPAASASSAPDDGEPWWVVQNKKANKAITRYIKERKYVKAVEAVFSMATEPFPGHAIILQKITSSAEAGCCCLATPCLLAPVLPTLLPAKAGTCCPSLSPESITLDTWDHSRGCTHKCLKDNHTELKAACKRVAIARLALGHTRQATTPKPGTNVSAALKCFAAFVSTCGKCVPIDREREVINAPGSTAGSGIVVGGAGPAAKPDDGDREAVKHEAKGRPAQSPAPVPCVHVCARTHHMHSCTHPRRLRWEH